MIINLVSICGLRQLIANLCYSENQFPLLGMNERIERKGERSKRHMQFVNQPSEAIFRSHSFFIFSPPLISTYLPSLLIFPFSSFPNSFSSFSPSPLSILFLYFPISYFSPYHVFPCPSFPSFFYSFVSSLFLIPSFLQSFLSLFLFPPVSSFLLYLLFPHPLTFISCQLM